MSRCFNISRSTGVLFPGLKLTVSRALCMVLVDHGKSSFFEVKCLSICEV